MRLQHCCDGCVFRQTVTSIICHVQLIHDADDVQDLVSDTKGRACCVCSTCDAFVTTDYVTLPGRQCTMCLQRARETKASSDACVADAAADVLDMVPLPPPGSYVRVVAQLPQGTEVPWLPEGSRRVGPVRNTTRCRVEGCQSKLKDPHPSGVCEFHRSNTIVWAMRPTECEPESWCDGCTGWRAAEPWSPLKPDNKRRTRCPKCYVIQQEDLAARRAKTKGLPVPASKRTKTPAPGTVIEDIPRQKKSRGDMITLAEAGEARSGGLLWMSSDAALFTTAPAAAPSAAPAPDTATASAERKAGGENRVRGEGKATHTCRVYDCGENATGKFVCKSHAGVVVHEEVAAGECAQQRYCKRCQRMKNAFDFRASGACGDKCNLVDVCRGDARRKKAGYVNRVFAGVAWPEDAGSPTLEQCREVAELMGVGLLHRADTAGCGHQPLGGQRCSAECAPGQRVCPAHIGTVAVSTDHAGMVWTCPGCQCEKPLEARGAGVCRACYAATAVGPSAAAGCSHATNADADCAMVEDTTAIEPPHAAQAQGGSPAADSPGDAAAPLNVVCFGDSDTDPDDPGGHRAPEPEADLCFRVGGSRPIAPAPPVPNADQVCSTPDCVKLLSAADGHGGHCFTCVVTTMRYAAPIDLIPLLLVPGALLNGQGVPPAAGNHHLGSCDGDNSGRL